jgi:flagellar basal-body rod protein FlgF
MLADSKKMDIITNNLANVNTNAYKRDTMVYQGFPSLLTKRINDTKSPSNPTGEIGSMTEGSDVGQVFTYYNQGSLVKSDNNLDLSIQDNTGLATSGTPQKNEAFFTVGIPDANGNLKEYYTRDGAFKISPDKQLQTRDGYAVMGENGPISLENDKFSVEPDGTIVQNGKTVDKLKMKEFTDTATLRKFGSNLVTTTDQSQEKAFSGAVQQGFVEQSNVNVVKEMVDMITVMRSYEANQKIIQAQDGTLDKAVNEVGSVR